MGPAHSIRSVGTFTSFALKSLRRGLNGEPGISLKPVMAKVPQMVGGILKRAADRLVSQGVDIPTAMSLYQALNDGNSKGKLFFIQEQDMDDAVKNMPGDLPAVPSTMKLHQVLTSLFLAYFGVAL